MDDGELPVGFVGEELMDGDLGVAVKSGMRSVGSRTSCREEGKRPEYGEVVERFGSSSVASSCRKNRSADDQRGRKREEKEGEVERGSGVAPPCCCR
jgi:hypothetical protein